MLDKYGDKILPKMYFIDDFLCKEVSLIKAKMQKIIYIGDNPPKAPTYDPRNLVNSLKVIDFTN